MANSSFTINAMIEPLWKRVRSSAARSQNVKNAAFSLSEYEAIPLLYLAATALLVGRLGLDLYGLWMLINSIVGISGVLNFGFGDSRLRFVSIYRGRGEALSIVRGIRTGYSASLILALVSATLMFLCAPLLVTVFNVPPEMHTIATQSFELGAALLALGMLDSVLKGAFQGQERYDLSAMVSLGGRDECLRQVSRAHGGQQSSISGGLKHPLNPMQYSRPTHSEYERAHYLGGY